MRKIFKKYNNTKTYMYPSGKLATPEIVAIDYPAVAVFTHVIQTDENEQILMSLDNLSLLRSMYEIDSSLSEDEAIAQIQEIANTKPEVSTEPTPEERTAAALEAMASGQTTENSEALDILLTGEEI